MDWKGEVVLSLEEKRGEMIDKHGEPLMLSERKQTIDDKVDIDSFVLHIGHIPHDDMVNDVVFFHNIHNTLVKRKNISFKWG